MIVSTYLLDNGLFGGLFNEDKVPINRGITSVMYENQFFYGVWNGTEWIEGATPEEIQQQELEQQKLLKQQQYEELLPTDWYVVRFLETGVAIPEEILQQRQAIREKYN